MLRPQLTVIDAAVAIDDCATLSLNQRARSLSASGDVGARQRRRGARPAVAVEFEHGFAFRHRLATDFALAHVTSPQRRVSSRAHAGTLHLFTIRVWCGDSGLKLAPNDSRQGNDGAFQVFAQRAVHVIGREVVSSLQMSHERTTQSRARHSSDDRGRAARLAGRQNK